MIPYPRIPLSTARKFILARVNSLTWFLILLGFTNFAGCGQNETKHESAAPQALSDAEADLEWAMKRLQRALDFHQSSTEAGLHIKREMNYEYKAADSTNSVPTAVVNVKTLTVLKAEVFAEKNNEDLSKNNENKESNKPEVNLLDPLADPSDAFSENFTNIAPDDEVIKKILKRKPAIDAQVAPRSMKEISTFNLVYQHNSWQLDKLPESELERTWFEYALQE